MESITFKLTGLGPLLMHNSRLADPLNDYAKQLKKISSKRSKTEDDHLEMARVEWMGGLYVDADGYPCVPTEMIEAALIGGAKKNKLGTAFKSSVFCNGEDIRLSYGGRKKAAALWGDKNFIDRRSVKVGMARVMRTRPRFADWALAVEVNYVPDLIDREAVIEAMKIAGRVCGIGDYRPKYGRFSVEEI